MARRMRWRGKDDDAMDGWVGGRATSTGAQINMSPTVA